MKKKLTYSFYLFLSILLLVSVSYADNAKNYGLFIGIDQYKDNQIKGPGTAVNDAFKIGGILEKKFGFKVSFLTGAKATKSNIESVVREYSLKLKKDDVLIIYFSGKSEVEPLYGYGWWLPYDSYYGDTMSYIDSVKVAEKLDNIKSRILVSTNTEIPPDFLASSVPLSLSGKDTHDIKFALVSKNRKPVISKKESGLSVLGYSLYKALEGIKGDKIYVSEVVAEAFSLAGQNGVGLEYKALGISKIKSGDFIFSNKPKKTSKKDKKVKKEDLVRESSIVKEEFGFLSMLSSPEETSYLINKKIKGTTPSEKIKLKPGVHNIRIFKSGYKDKNLKIELKPSENKEVNVKLEKIPPKKSKLKIVVKPLGSKIDFSNKKLTFRNGMKLNPGEYELIVSSPFYEKIIVKVLIKEGKDKILNVSLKPVSRFVNSHGIAFKRIKSGSFLMGTPLDEKRRGSDENLRKVIIQTDFFIMEKEVSVSQWKSFINDSKYKPNSFTSGGAEVWIGYKWEKDNDFSWESPGFSQNDNEPVTCVSWNDAVEFAKWMSKKEKLNYKLPTEAQWEYSCRASSAKTFAYGDCLLETQANFAANSKRGTCPEGKSRNRTIKTGSLKPNKWGLYDMHGNVMEWCLDWYAPYSQVEVVDPNGPENGEFKVLRGGSWETDINNSRSGNRFREKPLTSKNNIGFRLVLIP